MAGETAPAGDPASGVVKELRVEYELSGQPRSVSVAENRQLTLPLPGDATVEQLTAVLLDVAALSLRLNKPLTARLMPIPGKKAGDATHFDFAYFANSRILALPEVSLSGLLAGADVIPLNYRVPKISK